MTKCQGTKAGSLPRVCELPDHRWVVEKQEIIVRPEDVGEPAGMPITNMGMTFAENGDLLLVVDIMDRSAPHGTAPKMPRMVLLRSADRGHTWSQQGRLDLRVTEVGPECFVDMLRTDSGRLVGFLNALDQQYHVEKYPKAGDPYFIEGGHNFRLDVLRSAQCGVYSDDEGKTWNYAPMDISPFKSFLADTISVFQAADGTLVRPFIGHLSQDELDSALESTGLIRSRDGGLTWGDVSIVIKGRPGSAVWHNETSIVELPDGRWLCLARINDSNIDGFPLFSARCYSSDKGYTWTHPVRNRFPLAEHSLINLSDGAVISGGGSGGGTIEAHITPEGVLKLRSILVQENGNCRTIPYHISYDDGFTWSYWGVLYRTEPGSPEHAGSVNIKQLDDDTAIAVYHRGIDTATAKKQGGYGPMVIGASWLRKVSAESPEAAGLEYPEWLVEKVLQDAIDNARKIVTFPEEWHFRFDPDGKGLDEGWQKQTPFDDWDMMPIDLSGLMDRHPTHHFPSPNQLPEPRLQNLDIPWYATSFEMPDTGGISLMILFAGVDGYCDVFIDGRKVGGQELSQLITKQRPFCIPLEKGLPAGRHTMVVRVRKEYPRSAGIFRPVWIVAKSDVPLPPHAPVHNGGSLQ